MEADNGPRKASFAVSVFNYMHTALGSGILGLSYATAQLGIGLYMIFNFITVAMAVYAAHLFLKMSDQLKVKSIEEIGFAAFKRTGRLSAASSVLLTSIGSMCSYLFIIKNELPVIIRTFTGTSYLDEAWYNNGDILVVIITCCIVAPLSCLKNMRFFGYTSGFSMFCMMFFTVVVVAKKFMISCPLATSDWTDTNDNTTSTVEEDIGSADNIPTTYATPNATYSYVTKLREEFGPQQCTTEAFRPTKKWFYGLPMIVFAYCGQESLLPIYKELKNGCKSRMQIVVFTSLVGCLTLYTTAAIFGYLTFFNWSGEELLLIYSYAEPADILMTVVRLCVVVSVTLALPLVHFPTRRALSFVLFPEKGFSWFRHIGIMIVTLAFLDVVVIFVPHIRDVFAVTGATGCNLLLFILPSIFYLKLDESPRKSPQKIIASCLCCYGFVLLVGSLTLIIHGYVEA